MKRIFVSFAIEDKYLRDFFKGQSKNEHAPFEYIDMSVKKLGIHSGRQIAGLELKGVMVI